MRRRSPRGLSRPRRRQRRWWWSIAIAVAGVAGLLALVSRPLAFTVALATPEEEREAQRIIRTVSGRCCGGVIPQANWLWYPKETIRQHLTAAFPHYATFSFERRGWGTVHITGTLRTPFARWCRGQWNRIADLADPERLATVLPVRDCPAAVDAAGEVFRPPSEAAVLTIPPRQWVSGEEGGIPPRVLQGQGTEAFALLQALVRWFEARQIPVARIEETPIGIRLQLRPGPLLLLASVQHAEVIPTSLEAMLQQGAFPGGSKGTFRTLPEALTSVRYIDFRDFPRVYLGPRQ